MADNENENDGSFRGFLDMAEGLLKTAEQVSSGSCPDCGTPETFSLTASCACGWKLSMCLACFQAGGLMAARKLSGDILEHERGCKELGPCALEASRAFYDKQGR